MAEPSATSIHVKQIDHNTIVVSDLAQSIRFYTEVLGMRQVERPAFGFPGAWLQAGNTQIHMNVQGAEAGRAGLASGGGSVVSHGFHVAFEVEDCEAATARLAELKIPLAVGPHTRPDGARQLYLRDPDGHLIELFSTPST